MNNENPAYQSILDALPSSLHSVILPKLKEWDAGVTQKFQEIHKSYEDLKPFKKLVENNIDFDYAERAIILADELQRDPAKVINQINQSWNLGFVTPEQAQALQQQSTNSGDDSEFGDLGDGTDNDLLNNPQIKALQAALQQVQQEINNQKQQEQEEAELAQFDEYLDNLEKSVTEKGLPFHRTFVTALIHSGIDGEEAVKQYHQVLASNATVDDNVPGDQTNNDDSPPVVLGGSGNGSGTPDGTIDVGNLSNKDLNETVVQILAQQAAQNQG